MRQFKHYIMTRFNVGLYRSGAGVHISADEWMRHRIKLFTAFTLPSMKAQSCQDFTWLVFMDRRTPMIYREMLESVRYANMRLIYIDRWAPVKEQTVSQNVEPGDYTLITTRIDNDDAFHRDVVRVIQDEWYAQNAARSQPWVMLFPYGFILDLARKQMLVLEYWFNNCPTLVENSQNPQTVWCWQHDNIPVEIHKQYVTDKPYWLQVVHSQNVTNRMTNTAHKIIHKDIPTHLGLLACFGIDANSLPNP